MPTDFEIAFANARKQGLAQFTFNGKQYIPGNRSVAELKTIEEMGPVPEWLDDLIAEPDPKIKYIKE